MGATNSVVSKEEFKDAIYGTVVAVISQQVDPNVKFKRVEDIKDEDTNVLPSFDDNTGNYNKYYLDIREQAIDKYIVESVLDTQEHYDLFMTRLNSQLRRSLRTSHQPHPLRQPEAQALRQPEAQALRQPEAQALGQPEAQALRQPEAPRQEEYAERLVQQPERRVNTEYSQRRANTEYTSQRRANTEYTSQRRHATDESQIKENIQSEQLAIEPVHGQDLLRRKLNKVNNAIKNEQYYMEHNYEIEKPRGDSPITVEEAQ